LNCYCFASLSIGIIVVVVSFSASRDAQLRNTSETTIKLIGNIVLAIIWFVVKLSSSSGFVVAVSSGASRDAQVTKTKNPIKHD
jgi:hypothetical protein